jgi:hypothetical protein
MEFYQDLGAVPMDEWTTFRLTGAALDRLASSPDTSQPSAGVKKADPSVREPRNG